MDVGTTDDSTSPLLSSPGPNVTGLARQMLFALGREFPVTVPETVEHTMGV